jgi:hypothetical protein
MVTPLLNPSARDVYNRQFPLKTGFMLGHLLTKDTLCRTSRLLCIRLSQFETLSKAALVALGCPTISQVIDHRAVALQKVEPLGSEFCGRISLNSQSDLRYFHRKRWSQVV